MSKEIEQIFAIVSINELAKTNIPEEILENKIKKDLVYEISKQIIVHWDELPINYTKRCEESPNIFMEEHRIQLNIISNEELRRLRKIEQDYNMIQFKQR